MLPPFPPVGGNGVNFYDPGTAPIPFDVVWCKYPTREDPGRPGPWARPVLVLDNRLMEDTDGTEWAAITAAYGTDARNIKNLDATRHVLIPENEFRAVGLHKPTIFNVDLSNRRRMPWAEEYFVSQDYVVNRGILCGTLNADQEAKCHACFKALGLQFPLP
jgi:hypothetical protein